MIYSRIVKRLIDVLSSLVLLILFSPIILIFIVIVQLSSPGGALFKQIRVGKNGATFKLIKLRTMFKDPSRALSQTRSGDSDITPVGAVMRRFKIDELPQLINVLKGEMSLVGPRPCLPVTAQDAPGWARKRFEVRPGLTGLAQVNGNIGLSWEQRWLYDVNYVEAINWQLDCKILFKTILVVLVGEERFGSIP